MTINIDQKPDIKLSIKQTFGIDSDMEVEAFSKRTDWVYKSYKDLLDFLKNGVKCNGYNTFIHSSGFKNFISSYALD